MKQTSEIKLPYIILLALSALAVSVVGAVFSISGLTKLFSGAALSVMCMAGVLEFAKVVTAGFLHQYWERLAFVMKSYLTLAVFVLVCITSMGIYGYLSHAYQKSYVELQKAQIREKSLNSESREIQNELDRLNKNVQEVPATRVSKRIEMQKEYEPEIQKLKKRVFEINTTLQQVLIEKQIYQTEIGPLIYVAKVIGVEQDMAAQWFILLFVSVFDPLAICLVFATSWALKTRRQEMLKPFITTPLSRGIYSNGSDNSHAA